MNRWSLQIPCDHCGELVWKKKADINRSYKNRNALFFCDKICYGLHYREYKSIDQKKLEKKEYDRLYRLKNRELLKKKKADYFQKTYDPVKEAVKRKLKMPRHVEYCRRPEYREWKKGYDEKYRAKKVYGNFWESSILVKNLTKELDNVQIKTEKQLITKSQTRKRLCQKTKKSSLQLT